MSSFGGFGVPGTGSLEITTEKELLWGGDNGKGMALWKSAKISGATRDAGNTPTIDLRPGLLLGKATASGEYEEWDADASDGTQFFEGILDINLRAQDFNATNQDRVARVLIRGPVKAGQLLIEGTAFTSHLHEHLARRVMVAAGYIFDDDPLGYKAGTKRVQNKAADYTVVEDDNGTLFVAHTADCDFTLPTIRPGLVYEFLRASDHEMAVISSEGDNIIFGNDLSGDSATFTTAGEQIGAKMTLESHYINGTLKWVSRIDKTLFDVDDYLTSAIAT